MLIERIGNARANSVWEALCDSQRSGSSIFSGPSPPAKPLPTSTREEREAFIVAKYVQKVFVQKMQPSAAAALLYRSAAIGDLVDMVRAIAAGADINWRNQEDFMRSPLHVSCEGRHVLCVELLCLANASVDEKDAQGKTPLDYSVGADGAAILDILINKLERDLQMH